MRTLLHLVSALALAATPLGAAGETVKPATKKRGGFTGEKATAPQDGEPVLKPFATPSPARKKKAPVPADKATPPPAKKSASPASDSEAAPAGKKSPEDELPPGPKPAEPPRSAHAPAASLEPGQLADFDAQPPRVQRLLTAALALTKLNLTYTYGSADPARGGMDCSGAIYHVLREQGFPDIPRDSSGQYGWARKAGQFFSVVSTKADGFEFKELQPGDLMFWSGTYATGRDIPISHVMLYLGREKATGRRVMFGSSDGRSYAGIQRWGVSVFDFKMPNVDSSTPVLHVDFVGYARIPGLREPEEKTPAPRATDEPIQTREPPRSTPKPPARHPKKSS